MIDPFLKACGRTQVSLFRPFVSMSQTFHVECASPVSDSLFTLQDFVEYLNQKIKLNGLRNNHNGKITIESDASNNRVTVTSTVKYSKRAVRFYTRKFLQKQGLHQRFRVLAHSKDSYEIRPYGASKE